MIIMKLTLLGCSISLLFSGLCHGVSVPHTAGPGSLPFGFKQAAFHDIPSAKQPTIGCPSSNAPAALHSTHGCLR